MTRYIDLNCDMGESFGAYTIGMDDQVIEYITSANIACGFHAGDPVVLNRTVGMAAARGVGIGAHPGFPDLMGFGRRNLSCSPDEIYNYVIYQIGAIQAFCAAHGTRLQHVKPHGALYNMAAADTTVARRIAAAVAAVDRNLLLVALGGQTAPAMTEIGQEMGIRVIFEAFPDRAYTAEGTLVSRHKAGAVIHDPQQVAARALKMAADGQVVAEDGRILSLQVDTLCVHGDTPDALALVRQIRQVLADQHITVAPPGAHRAPAGN